MPEIEVSASAWHSRVQSSITIRIRIRRPSMNWSAAKSADQRSFGAEKWSAIIGGSVQVFRTVRCDMDKASTSRSGRSVSVNLSGCLLRPIGGRMVKSLRPPPDIVCAKRDCMRESDLRNIAGHPPGTPICVRRNDAIFAMMPTLIDRRWRGRVHLETWRHWPR